MPNDERGEGGGRGERRGFGLFRGRIEKFNRRTRSDALVMHRSGANLLSARCESEMEERKRRGDSLARSTVLPLAAITRHSSREKRPSPSLSLSVSSIVTDGLSALLYGVIKKIERPRIDPLCLPERSRESASVFSDTLTCPGGRVFLFSRWLCWRQSKDKMYKYTCMGITWLTFDFVEETYLLMSQMHSIIRYGRSEEERYDNVRVCINRVVFNFVKEDLLDIYLCDIRNVWNAFELRLWVSQWVNISSTTLLSFPRYIDFCSELKWPSWWMLFGRIRNRIISMISARSYERHL